MIFVIQVKPKTEYLLLQNLKRENIQAYAPMEEFQFRQGGRWHTENRYIFSNYIFIDIKEYSPEIYQKIKRCDGFLKILGEPSSLSATEAEQIKWLCNNGKPIKTSKFIMENGKAKFVSGIMSRLSHKIIRFYPRQRRVKIAITIHGKEFYVTLPIQKYAE